MFSTDDTIVAIATPPGRAGLGIVRLSGPDAARIAGQLVGRREPFTSRHATLARLAAAESNSGSNHHTAVPDQVVVTIFAAPASYTGEDVAEISAHGSPVVLQDIVQRSIRAGARLAEPGEFTLRAFLHGKVDLVQAEAVADLINAVTPLQARAAFDQLEGTLTVAIGEIERDLFDLSARLEASLDFPEEGYHFVAAGEAGATIANLRRRIDSLLSNAARGRMIREGAQVAIVGAPNVGKSSLFNALLNANRAIVTDSPGTTRDLLTERADIGGMSVALVDTAGIRETGEPVEQEGVARARQSMRVADLVLVLLDRSRALTDEDEHVLEATAARPRLIVVNKIDLAVARGRAIPDSVFGERVCVSVKTGEGLDTLLERIAGALGAGAELRDSPLVTNVRHAALLDRAGESLGRALAALESSSGTLPEEFLLADLQDAAGHLQEITGRRSTEDLLRHIFERFCIGK